MSVGSRIKELREYRGLSRSELAKRLGVTVGAISNYENGVSSPKEPILFNIMDTLDCDANYIFQDAMKQSTYKDSATPEEFENIIAKYRMLDAHGKEMVNFTLEKEYERSSQESERKSSITQAMGSKTIDPKTSYLQEEIYPYHVNAAHQRTDIDIPEGIDTSEDDIMDDDNF